MKILWFAHRDIKNPRAGGAERTLYEVGKRLIEKGVDVNVVSVNPKALKKYEIVEGIKIYRIKGNVKTHLMVHRMIKKINPDIIIDDMGHAVPWLSPWFTKKPVIVLFYHLHARSLPGQVNHLLAYIITQIEKKYSFFYKNNIFITESSTSKNDLINLSIKESNIVMIPLGVDLKTFYPGNKTKNIQLIYFGGFRKYKRPEFAIKVYEMLYKDIKDLKFLIIGDGPVLSSIKDSIRNREYNIEFIGQLDHEKLSLLIRESWINLHFSVTEGWGLSIMEASASGTPTVAFKVPGVVDTVINGYNGYLVNNIDEFKDKILDIIKNKNKFSKNAREYAENFPWNKITDMWYDLLCKYTKK